MFSFIKKYAETLNGVDVYGDIALVIFVTIFLGAIVFALSVKKDYIKELERIPFS